MLRVMDRKKPKGKPQVKATVIVFLVSAIWHGTYPGFFIMFVSCALMDIANRNISKLNFVVSIANALPVNLKLLILWFWNFGFAGYFTVAFIYLEYGYFA